MNKLIGLLTVMAMAMFMMASKAEASRLGNGWNVTVVTGTAKDVFTGRGYVKSITLSEGAGLNDYAVVMNTAPVRATGGGVSLIPSDVTLSTIAVTYLVYTSTGANSFDAGDCDTCYFEIPDNGSLHIRQTTQASGTRNRITVLWSR